MKLLERNSEHKISDKIDFSVFPDIQEEASKNVTPAVDSRIPAYFYSQGIPKDGSKVGFFKRIGLIIARIKSLARSIRVAFGPFKLLKKDFVTENNAEKTQPQSVVSSVSIIEEKITIEVQASPVLDTTTDIVTPQIAEARQDEIVISEVLHEVAASIVLDAPHASEQALESEKSAFYTEIFNKLPALEEIAIQYSSAISTFFATFAEKKPKKVAQYRAIVQEYEVSREYIAIKEAELQKIRTTLGSTKERGVANPLESLYISYLLPHTISATHTIDTAAFNAKATHKDNDFSGDATLEILKEFNHIFTSFNTAALKKVYSDLCMKTLEFFNQPSSKKRKNLAYTTESDRIIEQVPASFAKLKKHFTQEAQLTIEVETRVVEKYDAGREVLWNWYKHHQTESVKDTQLLLEYGLVYLKVLTIINKRYASILESLIKNSRAVEKLHRTVSKLIK